MIRNVLPAAAVAAALSGAPTPASADEAALQGQLAELRATLAEQRAQLDAQAKLLEAQQARLDALSQQLVARPGAPPPRVALDNGRPSLAAADGRSSFALRANVQLDGALHGKSPEGPLTSDLRRGAAATSRFSRSGSTGIRTRTSRSW
jgi:phosphate-selective porin OprO and OprP